MHWGEAWPPFERFTAGCSRNRILGDQHPVPWRRHACGIYALADRADAERNWMAGLVFPSSQEPVAGSVPAYGQVSMWGRVIEHEVGWRAQHAYPYSIFLPAGMRGSAVDCGRLAERVRGQYGVEVELVDGRDIFDD